MTLKVKRYLKAKAAQRACLKEAERWQDLARVVMGHMRGGEVGQATRADATNPYEAKVRVKVEGGPRGEAGEETTREE